MDIFTTNLIAFLLGIFTNRVDEMLIAPTLDNILNRFKQNDRQVNQELEKALRLCFLSALQTIVRECHKELIGLSPVQRYRGITIYPPEYKEEIQWLDQKLKQLVKEQKQVKQTEYAEMPLKSIDEIASMLTSEGQLVIREKLIIEALKDDFIPKCYADKVRAVLFEQMRDNFISEIKYNRALRNIFEANLLANINANLTEKKLKIQDLENSSYQTEARRKIKLEFDVDKLDTARLEAIVQHLQKLLDDGSIKLRRVEEGCMDLIFDGSQKSLEKLDALFKSGELAEILGIPVQDVRGADSDVSLNETVVSLSQWLQNVIGASWQTVEDVLGTQKANLVFANRSIFNVDSVVRAKRINLEIPGDEISLGLVVAVIPKTIDSREIYMQVHSNSSKTLPQELKCIVIDILEKKLLEVKAKNNDKWIQLNISGQVGEKFSIQIQLEQANFIQNFVI